MKNGWPIATGSVEGACRHLVGDRLDITGARWGQLAGPKREAVAICVRYLTGHLARLRYDIHQRTYPDQRDYQLTA